jgi:hypothetical protein
MSNVAEDSGFAVVCLRGLRERLSSAGGLVVSVRPFASIKSATVESSSGSLHLVSFVLLL